jgi:hypothetical protein
MAEPTNFERDPGAGASLAASFGSGSGNAEQLIELNQLRYSEALLTANQLPLDVEATAELDRSAVASAAGLDDEKAVLDYAVRGDFCTFVALAPDGRTYKAVLEFADGSLSDVDPSQDPQRARVAAQVQAAREVIEAQDEAAKIIAEAQQKANELVAQAAQQGQENVAEASGQAAEEQQQEQESGGTTEEEVGGTTPAQRTRARQGSSARHAARTASDQPGSG